MKKGKRYHSAKIAVLSGICLFGLSQIVLRIAMEQIDGLRDPQYAVKTGYLRHQLVTNPNRPLWLFLGTSKTNNGIVPPLVFENIPDAEKPLVYNFGLGAADLLRQYLALQRLLKEGIKPDVLGVEFFIPILGQEVPRFSMVPELVMLARKDELEILASYNPEKKKIISLWNQSRIVPIYGCRRTFTGKSMFQWLRYELGIPTLRDVDGHGWQQIPSGSIAPKTYERRIKALQREYEGYWTETPVSKANQDILVKIKEACKQNGITFFLYQMPESEIFRSFYPADRTENIRLFSKHFQQEHGVPFLNAHDWMNEADFFDGLHLSANGAQDFTRRFGKELIPLIQAIPRE